MSDARTKGKRLIKNSVLNILNSFVTMAVTFITSIVVARTLKPEMYGIFNLILWVTGISTWAIGMGLVQAVTKYIAEYTGRGQSEEISSIVIFVLKIEIILSVICTIILVFFKTRIADYFFTPNEAFYFLIAFIGLVPGIVTAVFSSAIEGIQKFEYFTYFHLIVTPLAFAAKLIVLYMGYRIDGLLIVTLIFSFLNTFFFYWILKREGISFNIFRHPIRKQTRSEILRYNFSVSSILVVDKIVWDKSENYFLGRYCSAAQIGYYNLAFNVTQRFMSVLPTTFWRVLFPAMSEYFGSGDKDKIKRIYYIASRYLAFFSFPVGVAGIILSYPMLKFLYGYDYTAAKYPLQIIFLCSIFSSLATPGSAVIYGIGKQGFIFRYGIVLAVVNILLDILLIKKYGAIGAATCYGIVTIAGSVGGLIFLYRKVGLVYPFKSVSKIIFSTILMGVSIQMVIGHRSEMMSFILSIPVGIFVYFISSVVLGSFEEEDYILMNSVKAVLPERFCGIINVLVGFLSSFKESEKK